MQIYSRNVISGWFYCGRSDEKKGIRFECEHNACACGEVQTSGEQRARTWEAPSALGLRVSRAEAAEAAAAKSPVAAPEPCPGTVMVAEAGRPLPLRPNMAAGFLSSSSSLHESAHATYECFKDSGTMGISCMNNTDNAEINNSDDTDNGILIHEISQNDDGHGPIICISGHGSTSDKMRKNKQKVADTPIRNTFIWGSPFTLTNGKTSWEACLCLKDRLAVMPKHQRVQTGPDAAVTHTKHAHRPL